MGQDFIAFSTRLYVLPVFREVSQLMILQDHLATRTKMNTTMRKSLSEHPIGLLQLQLQ